ncbi:hypothetical protein PN36_03620 [Candidatus Thiomargarita nelsonii]|uniref:Uncharacterized protein n=1 Tax=Candidatus Thiomargarita nelsonii TaxID=1003181 RepID=A0A4E0R5E2_9GAMM|nr:hypothetical protein PN36_03620 [Candidatus Thiomargarita nelsonii]
MGKIILDDYLTSRGVTEENCRIALNLTKHDLAEHTITIKLVKEAKECGNFWSLQLFLDDNPKGVTIGVSNSRRKSINKWVDELTRVTKKKKKLRGKWPRKQPFFEWFKQREPIRQQAKEKKAAEDRKQNLLPISLQLIANFQKPIPELGPLRKAYNELPQEISPKFRSSGYRKLEKKLSAMIAYWETDWDARAVAATEENKQISLWEKNKQLSFWDNELTLILKMDSTGKQMEYQGIAFNLEDIYTTYHQVPMLKAQMDQKMVEERFKLLLLEIPRQLDAQIKALQQQAPQHWDKISFLNARDLIFMEGYNHPRFNFHKVMKVHIQTQAQMNNWILEWIARVEKAFATASRVDGFTQAILGLIASSPKYGVQTYASWLGNSKAGMLEHKKLDKKFRYALKGNTIVSIADKIHALIGYKWLAEATVSTYYLSVLVATDNGKKIWQLLEQGKIKVIATQPPVDIHSHHYWIKEIQQKEHTAYVSFLNTPQSVANLAKWTEEEVAAMQQTLDEHLNGWQVLARWKLSKQSTNYKPLRRLLSRYT